MRVFLSWSGIRSKKLAQALHLWLKHVVQAVQPWMSDRDIDPGQRWTSEIAARLQETTFGVICLTPENVNAPWLLFEAGALAKSMDAARVVPVLYDLSPADLTFPLAQFQAVRADRDGMFALVGALNAVLGEAKLPGEIVAATFDALWPRLVSALEAIPSPDQHMDGHPRRDDRQVLEEVLEGVRIIRRSIAEPASSFVRRQLSGVQDASTTTDDWEDYFTRGVHFANQREGQTSDMAALRSYNEAIALLREDVEGPRRARLFGYRGAMFKRLGRLDEALSDLLLAEKWAAQDYEIDDVRYNKACVLCMMGRREEALGVLGQLFASDQSWKGVVRGRTSTYFANLAGDARFQALLEGSLTHN